MGMGEGFHETPGHIMCDMLHMFITDTCQVQVDHILVSYIFLYFVFFLILTTLLRFHLCFKGIG